MRKFFKSEPERSSTAGLNASSSGAETLDGRGGGASDGVSMHGVLVLVEL